jgi:hypothetical protein
MDKHQVWDTRHGLRITSTSHIGVIDYEPSYHHSGTKVPRDKHATIDNDVQYKTPQTTQELYGMMGEREGQHHDQEIEGCATISGPKVGTDDKAHQTSDDDQEHLEDDPDHEREHGREGWEQRGAGCRTVQGGAVWGTATWAGPVV